MVDMSVGPSQLPAAHNGRHGCIMRLWGLLGIRRLQRLIRLRIGAVFFLIAATVSPFSAAEALVAEPSVIYLLDIQVGDYTLATDVVTYEVDGDYLVHFAAFLASVEFPIHRQGRAWSGWFRSQGSRFSWNMDSGAVQAGGRRSGTGSLNARWVESGDETFTHVRERRQWIETEEGTFVSLRALERWFDLELAIDTRTQILTVASSEPLPFEQRLARASLKNGARSGASQTAGTRLPDQYRWVTLPLVDMTVNHRSWSNGTGERGSSADLAMAAGFDLLKHSAVYAGSSGGGQQRLTLTRKAATPADTLLLGANRYEFGDIFAPNSNLVSAGGDGLGFRIERQRNGRSSSLNVLTISGDATPGWDAELYRNGVLITFGTVGGDGRYLFPDQQTVYGENVFLVKLFGPRGEIDERRHVYWAGGLELTKGDYTYSFSHVDFSRRFLGGDRDTIGGLASRQTSDARYAYALSDHLQLGAGYTRAQLGSREADGSFTEVSYGTLDARMNVGHGLLLTEFVKEQEDGSAWSVNYLTTLRAHNVSLSHQSFRNFESPYTIRKEDLDSRNQLSFSGPLELAGLSNYSFRITHLERAEGFDDYRIFKRIGAHWGPINVSSDLEYFRVGVGDSFYQGHVRIAGRQGRFNVRGQLDYSSTTERLVNQVSGSVSWAVNRRVNTDITIRKNMHDDGETYIESRSSIRFGAGNLSLGLYAGSDDTWTATVGFNTRFGYDPDSTNFFSADHSLARTGRARLNLFLDSNNNGVREAGEEPIRWASYDKRTMSAKRPGVLQLTSIPADTPLRLRSGDLRFEDPFLFAADDSYELYTHPGSDIDVDIPVLIGGDVEGYLYPGSGMDDTDLRGVAVLLYDANDDEVAVTLSEFDGYYTFSGIPIGDYKVVVMPDADKPDYYLQRFSLDAEDNYVMLDAIHLWKR